MRINLGVIFPGNDYRFPRHGSRLAEEDRLRPGTAPRVAVALETDVQRRVRDVDFQRVAIGDGNARTALAPGGDAAGVGGSQVIRGMMVT
jgi:hypothetical protein